MAHVPIEHVAVPIRWCAGISFAAYLFHMPLLTLCAGFLPANQGWLALTFTFAVIALLGPPVERSKGWCRRHLQASMELLILVSRRVSLSY